MTPSSQTTPDGLEAAFLAHREVLLRFLRARGAGDAAEDLLQEVWLRLHQAQTGPVAAPLAYLHRIANTVMIDRYRSDRQAAKRERDWVEAVSGGDPAVADSPLPDRALIGREQLDRVTRAIESLGTRPADVFRRHRIEGQPQRQVAADLSISISTVESDLRAVYRLIGQLRDEFDEV